MFLQNRATVMLHPPEDVNSNGCTGTANIVRHPDFCVIDLPLPGSPRSLLDDLVDLLDTGRTDRVTAGFESAARVDWDLPAKCGLSVSRELTRCSFLTEPEVFDCADLRDRETVMHFHHVDILV